CARGDNSTVHEDHVVGCCSLIEIVRCQNDRMAVFFNLSMNNVVNKSHGLQIEAGHAFVQYQDYVALRDALCNIRALTLTSGKFFKVTVLEVGNVHRFHRIIDGRPVVRTENTKPPALRITAHADHVFDGNWGTSWEDH